MEKSDESKKIRRKFTTDIESKITDDEKNFTAIESLFGRDWLEENLDTPIHRLWFDPSTQASLELFYFDQSMRWIPKIPGSWLDDRQRNIQSDPNQRKVAGYLTEIVMAGLFAKAGFDVCLPGNKQKTYDIVVSRTGSKKIRVSCKYVGPKDSELLFERRMAVLRTILSFHLVPQHPLLFHVNAESRDYDSIHKTIIETFPSIYERIKQQSVPWRFGKNGLFSVDTIPLERVLPYEFSAHRSSHSFLATTAIHPNEQKKFEDLLHRVNTEFGAFSQNSDEGNILTVLLSPSLDWSRASARVKEMFSKGELKYLDAIFMLRVQPTFQAVGDGFLSGVTNEVLYIFNSTKYLQSNWTHELFGGPTNWVFPVGMVSMEPISHSAHIGNHILKLDGNYKYFFGEHYYETNAKEFDLVDLPNMNIYVISTVPSDKPLRFTTKDKSRTSFLLV